MIMPSLFLYKVIVIINDGSELGFLILIM